MSKFCVVIGDAPHLKKKKDQCHLFEYLPKRMILKNNKINLSYRKDIKEEAHNLRPKL